MAEFFRARVRQRLHLRQNCLLRHLGGQPQRAASDQMVLLAPSHERGAAHSRPPPTRIQHLHLAPLPESKLGHYQQGRPTLTAVILSDRSKAKGVEGPAFLLSDARKKAQGLHPGPSSISDCSRSYSAAASTGLVCATVHSGAPTLKRAKRRTVMFSPSLPTFIAISSLMLIAWSLMKGCSSRQTSS